ncbi:MAG: HisA/HisF-related TIM barrel protein [Cytophagales bacterium]|nr:HisA/HisF-related TIM barrel protein [Cytophagales bacterium]
MIQVIPSIAIRKGKVVKMRKGDPASEKAYDENPLDLAKRFADHGIDVVHSSRPGWSRARESKKLPCAGSYSGSYRFES